MLICTYLVARASYLFPVKMSQGLPTLLHGCPPGTPPSLKGIVRPTQQGETTDRHSTAFEPTPAGITGWKKFRTQEGEEAKGGAGQPRLGGGELSKSANYPNP